MYSKNIDPAKKAVLESVINQAKDKKPADLINFLVSYARSNNQVNFTDSETDLIVNELKKNMNENDIKKLDTLKQLSNLINSRAKKAPKNVS